MDEHVWKQTTWVIWSFYCSVQSSPSELPAILSEEIIYWQYWLTSDPSVSLTCAHTQLQQHSGAHCHTQMHMYLLQSLHSSVTTRFTTQQFFFPTPTPYRVNMHTDVLSNTHTHAHTWWMLTPHVLVFRVFSTVWVCTAHVTGVLWE